MASSAQPTTPPSTTSLIFVDFQGTLSPRSTAFGDQPVLEMALRSAGLPRWGLANSKTYWEQIAAPTWPDSAITPFGLAEAITQRIMEGHCKDGEDVPTPTLLQRKEVLRSARNFMNRYSAAAQIDPAWDRFLRLGTIYKDAKIIVATDHYADITPGLTASIASFGMRSYVINPSDADLSDCARYRLCHQMEDADVIVANSGLLSGLKASSAFWENVKKSLPRRFQNPRTILLIDDFGFNEVSGNDYAVDAKVISRRQTTMELLHSVFTGTSSISDFFFKVGPPGSPAYGPPPPPAEPPPPVSPGRAKDSHHHHHRHKAKQPEPTEFARMVAEATQAAEKCIQKALK